MFIPLQLLSAYPIVAFIAGLCGSLSLYQEHSSMLLKEQQKVAPYDKMDTEKPDTQQGQKIKVKENGI